MSSMHRHKGFSLTEVLLAIGTLAIGMSFVGGTFLVGVHLSAVATERTIAAATADEAFTKIQLYGIDFSSPDLVENQQVLYTNVNSISIDTFAQELAYPSTRINTDKQYYWSALCRPVSLNTVNRNFQVTVFIVRKVGSSSEIPFPVEVPVTKVSETSLAINLPAQESFINAGSKIIANQTGKLYRVVDRDTISGNTIILDETWQGLDTDSIWVIPPTFAGKNPCIAVYQKEIRF